MQKRLLYLFLSVLICMSCFSVLSEAATTINYAPNPKVEYSYSADVKAGTIRYISQINGSAYFNSSYWGNWAGQAGIECGTASVSMALSYVGVNKTPKEILDAHSGTTYFTGWGPSTSNPSVATGMSNYINGNGKYSPPIVHFTSGYSSGSHYVVLIGQVSSNAYLVLDPATNNTWTLTTSDAKYKSINQVFQYYNANASIEPDVQQPTSIIYPNDGGIYKIASGVGNNMYLDFACTNDNVQIYENCDNHSDPAFVISQYYKITHVGDGWHSIINIGNGKAMDVDGGNSASETNIHQWAYDGNNAQLFRFYDAGDGYCYIKSKLGCYVDVQNGDNVNNTNVWTYTFNGSNAQKWKVESHSHSYSSQVTKTATCTSTGVRTYTCSKCKHSYTETIAKKAHSYTASVTTQPTCTATGVKTYKCSCGASYTETIAMAKHFDNNANNRCDSCDKLLINEPNVIIYPADGSIVKLASGVGNNMYLDFNYSNNNVQIYEDCDGHSDPDWVKGQYFKLNHIGDGWYTIVNVGNGNCVDTQNENPASGTNLMHWECYFNNGQLFRFYDAGNGYCYIKSKLGCYIDVFNGGNTNNTNVQMYKFNGTDAQKWKLESHSHSYSSQVTKTATCTSTGVRTYTCSKCKHSYTETIAQTAHSYTSSVTTQPTCTANGVKTYKCSCGASYTETIAVAGHKWTAATCTAPKTCSVCKATDGAALGHSYTSTVTKAATCTAAGVKTFTCSKCSNSYTETIPATGHKWTAATCTAAKTCSVCKATDGAALGHSYTSKITKVATCTAAGIKTFTCSMCTHSYTENIPATGHKWTAATCTASKTCSVCKTTDGAALGHNYTSKVTKAATCTAAGVKTFTCSKCSNSYTESIAATGHTWTAATCTAAKTCSLCKVTDGSALGHSYTSKVTKAATCTAAGIKTFTCENDANHTYTETIPALGHTEEIIPAVAATCTATGLTEGKKCSVCGEVLLEQVEAPVLGHAYKSAVTKEPTCTVDGVKTFTCENDANHTYTETIPALGHTEEIIPAVAATCTATGLTEGKKCSVCGEILVAQTATPVVDHADADGDGLCDHCGEQLAPLFVIGDVDGDNEVTSSDARLALRAAVKLETLTEAQTQAADADKDGEISSSDARLILRAAVGLETL